jgi:hypothetical protein
VLDHTDSRLLLLCAERSSLARVSITNGVLQANGFLPREAWQNPQAIHAISETGSGSICENSVIKFPNRPTAMVQCLHQPIQTISISFVPLFGNIGSATQNGVSIHLFGSTERRLKRLPPHDPLVNAVVRVCASKGRIRKRPLAGIEAVALVDEGGRVLCGQLQNVSCP